RSPIIEHTLHTTSIAPCTLGFKFKSNYNKGFVFISAIPNNRIKEKGVEFDLQNSFKKKRIVPCFHFSFQSPLAFGFRFFNQQLGVFTSIPNTQTEEINTWVISEKDLSSASLAMKYSPKSNLFFLINLIVDENLNTQSSTFIQHSIDMSYTQASRHYYTQDKYGSSLNRSFDVKMNKLALMYRFSVASRKHKVFRPTFFVSGGISIIDFHSIYKNPYPASFNQNELLVKPRFDLGITVPLIIEW
ncbi:MAG TPA: hypothetical protein VGF79_12650, partial [Bacteroidia bacterium]